MYNLFSQFPRTYCYLFMLMTEMAAYQLENVNKIPTFLHFVALWVLLETISV